MRVYPRRNSPREREGEEKHLWEKADGERLRELAQFLRTRRARMTPEQAGLKVEGRRRTPGLRRSEVALLAGISVDWYTWLEQGRNIQVSSQVTESIARALQLDADEKKHLFLLALQQYPPVSEEAAAEITAGASAVSGPAGNKPGLRDRPALKHRGMEPDRQHGVWRI